MPLLRISALGSRELQAMTAHLKRVDADARKAIRRELKTWAQPEWQRAVAEQAAQAAGIVPPRLSAKLLVKTARVAVSDRNLMLQSARVGRPLSGGLNPKTQWHVAEFGVTDRNEARAYEGRRGSKRFTVKRHTRRMLPPRNNRGHVVYPAAALFIPRVAALYVQTYARAIHEAVKGGA